MEGCCAVGLPLSLLAIESLSLGLRSLRGQQRFLGELFLNGWPRTKIGLDCTSNPLLHQTNGEVVHFPGVIGTTTKLNDCIVAKGGRAQRALDILLIFLDYKRHTFQSWEKCEAGALLSGRDGMVGGGKEQFL